MISYHSVQVIPNVIVREPDVLAAVLSDYTEMLLNTIVDAGINPLDGSLTIQPSKPDLVQEVRFTWTPLE